VLYARPQPAIEWHGGGVRENFKRDYVYTHDRPDPQTVLSQLSNWFEDYNEVHPHKALRLKSPREFIDRSPKNRTGRKVSFATQSSPGGRRCGREEEALYR
jgi:hypothetical protein